MSQYYDRVASIYDVGNPIPQLILEQVTDCILNLVAATSQTTFLEPGIGTGRTALPIIRRGYAYTGIDISMPMLDELRRKLEGVPNNLTLLQADVSSLPFSSSSFDVVLTLHVLQVVPDWLKALSEIRRVLKPGGLYLYCNNVWTTHQMEFDRQWRAILSQHQSGFEMKMTKSWQGDLVAMQTLKEQKATLETITAAQWLVEQTVGDLLKIYQMRSHGSCWEVPDDVFFQAMQDFTTWCLQHYGSEDVVLSSDATFDITVVKNWATG